MTIFQRIKNIAIGVILLIVAVVLVLYPQITFQLIPALLGIALLLYGFRLLWYYQQMARHMVGGKSVLIRAALVMDVALFTSSITLMNDQIIVLPYLLAIYAFTGVVDILRATEAKQAGSPGWQLKLSQGVIAILFVIALFIIGFIIGRKDIFVYGFAFSLVYSATMRIIGALKRTAVVYIR